MSNELDWIAARVTQARKVHSSVTEAVSAGLEQLLKDQLSERQLPPAQLARIAKGLIADMVPAPREAEATE